VGGIPPFAGLKWGFGTARALAHQLFHALALLRGELATDVFAHLPEYVLDIGLEQNEEVGNALAAIPDDAIDLGALVGSEALELIGHTAQGLKAGREHLMRWRGCPRSRGLPDQQTAGHHTGGENDQSS